MRAFDFMLTASLVGLSFAQSLTGNRVLFLTDAGFSQEKYSIFYSLLKGRGYEIKLEKATEAELSIIRSDERLYDHIIFFSPETKVKSKSLAESNILEFIGLGGNIMMVADSKVHNATDAPNSWEHIIAHPKASKFISASTSSGRPIVFEGIAHSISNTQPQIASLLQPSPTAYSSLQSAFGNPGLYGTEISLVSAHQSRNNARFTVFGSTEMFSDKFLTAPVAEKLLKGGQKSHDVSGNQAFIEDLIKWTFQEAGVIKSTGFFHSKVGESERPANYRIKDEIVYSINLTEYRDGKWVAFKADDVQLEVTMLDPHIRATLPVVSSVTDKAGNELATYRLKLTLPDVYGVFTFRVNYRREGLSGILVEDVIPIHPFRHNEFPRFLLQAFPYYASTFSMSAGFILFSTIWLYNRDTGVLAKNKKA
ncbi:oligosaccharyl transferase glycoprotein complex, beta subunit [Entomophthora muscae]|uniref:Oligosaccharyl transferase glycoprotein complex, beta subunit n=1 Tax=Entomophthora muscae TaxID=34485 RepID=A0ACC2TFX3_9FUNG|nr:oligosaccharyl transferase glycoprotein complex, beta subunit [Entomophthora muscae]